MVTRRLRPCHRLPAYLNDNDCCSPAFPARRRTLELAPVNREEQLYHAGRLTIKKKRKRRDRDGGDCWTRRGSKKRHPNFSILIKRETNLDVGRIALAVLPRQRDGGEQSVGVIEFATLQRQKHGCHRFLRKAKEIYPSTNELS